MPTKIGHGTSVPITNKNTGVQGIAEAIQNQFAGDAKSDNVSLGHEGRIVIENIMNMNNPMLAYTRGLQVKDKNAAATTFKWDGDQNKLFAKTGLGNSKYYGVKEQRKTVYWNEPLIKPEGMTAYDLRFGAMNTLALRMEKTAKKFLQDRIKDAFAVMSGGTAATYDANGMVTDSRTHAVKATATVATTTNGINHRKVVNKTVSDMITGAAAVTATVQEQGMLLKREIVKAATAFKNRTQYTKDMFTITLPDVMMDLLADAKMLGNAVEQTFVGGSYTVAKVGGYTVQGGEIFFGGDVVPVGGGTLNIDGRFIIGANNSMIWKSAVIAANAGKIDLTNDNGTYIELADMLDKSPIKAIDHNDEQMKQNVNIIEVIDIAAA